MAVVRVAPNLVSPLRLDHLERNGAHRRDGCELDESFGFRVTELRRRMGEGLEAGDEEALRPLAACFVDHAHIFVAGSDGPPEHLVPGT